MTDPEVIIEANGEPSQNASRMIPPPVRFNMASTVQSPFFWVVVGIGVGLGLSWWLGSDRKKEKRGLFS